MFGTLGAIAGANGTLGASMRVGIKRLTCGNTWLFLMGMACFWPCVQTSPYRELAVRYQALDTVVNFGLILPAAVAVASVLLGMGLLQRAAGNRMLDACIAGAVGSLGFLGFILSFWLTGFLVDALIVVSCIAVSFSVMSLLIGWGSVVIAQEGAGDERLFSAMLAFVVYETIDLVFCFIPVDLVYLIVIFPFVSGLCLGRFKNEARGLSWGVNRVALSKMPWGLIVASTIFVLLNNMFVKVLSVHSDEGAGSTRAPMILLLLVYCALVYVYMRRASFSRVSVLVVFIGCYVLHVVGLFLILLRFNVASVLENQAWLAPGMVLKLFLWIALAYYARCYRLAPRAVFAYYGAFLVAAPFSISLDMDGSNGLVALLAGVDSLSFAGEIMFFLVALVITAVLVQQLVSVSRTKAPETDSSEAERVHVALSGFSLTAREMEIAGLACCGMSAKRIAEQLSLSEFTVNNHLSHIYRKMGIHSKQDLIAYVQEYRER